MTNIDTNAPAILPAAFSINEAADYIGLGRDGIYRAISEGRLRARKFGKRTLILRNDADAFLQVLPEKAIA